MLALLTDPQALVDTANTRMAFGRMALIGDAAFTARPTTGAGTTKAAINGIELGKALHGISTNGVVGALREWEAEQIVIGRTLVARGAAATDNPVVVSGTKSAFPSDYTLGKLAAMPPHAPTVSAAIADYLADPTAAEQRTERVYLSPAAKKEREQRPNDFSGPPPETTAPTMGFGAARLAAERGDNDLGRYMRRPAL